MDLVFKHVYVTLARSFIPSLLLRVPFSTSLYPWLLGPLWWTVIVSYHSFSSRSARRNFDCPQHVYHGGSFVHGVMRLWFTQGLLWSLMVSVLMPSCVRTHYPRHVLFSIYCFVIDCSPISLIHFAYQI